MSSINAATIQTLVNAISGGLTSGQTYDLVRKIAEDLDSVFSTVNSGPLKAVDASALLHINPVNIDSPGDNPQLVLSQGKVAFINWANIFSKSQTFTTDVLFSAGIGIWTPDATVPANLRFYVDANGVILRMGAGAINIQDNAGNLKAATFASGAIVSRNQVTDPGASGFYADNNRGLSGVNAAASAFLKMITIDTNDVVRLGLDANSGSRVGHVGVPQKTTANMPPAAAASDGIIAIDKTLNTLCYWVNGTRLAIPAGAAF
jgi:hypothetical protein